MHMNSIIKVWYDQIETCIPRNAPSTGTAGELIAYDATYSCS